MAYLGHIARKGTRRLHPFTRFVGCPRSGTIEEAGGSKRHTSELTWGSHVQDPRPRPHPTLSRTWSGAARIRESRGTAEQRVRPRAGPPAAVLGRIASRLQRHALLRTEPDHPSRPRQRE